MEWVETTGRTVEDAKEEALDKLGVDEADAEFDVVEEPKSGLFGRLRSEARVRARVRPTAPRPKVERRDRKPKTREGAGEAAPKPVPARPAAKAAAKTTADSSTRRVAMEDAPMTDTSMSVVDEDEPTMAEQGATAASFLSGLLVAADVQGDVTVVEVDTDTIEVSVEGDDLGLLIGPKGATLGAVQELSRTVVQRTMAGGRGARLHIDIGQYRLRRRDALARFTRQLAAQVVDSGRASALEPMGAADRKVVHDTANDIDGVQTRSEGEEPRRRVIIELVP